MIPKMRQTRISSHIIQMKALRKIPRPWRFQTLMLCRMAFHVVSQPKPMVNPQKIDASLASSEDTSSGT